jgi:hypothetical protein
MRSPMPPQIGENTADESALAERIAPAHTSTLLSGKTPFCSRNCGKNGDE